MFKIGDRVTGQVTPGIGTILAEKTYKRSGKYYQVDFPGYPAIWHPENELKPAVQSSPIQFDDIESGLGIGGAGSDDFNIHTEGDLHPDDSGYDRNRYRPGQQVSPAGTTYGQRGDDDDVCVYCGRPGDWNSGAGRVLCERHWDEY